MEHAPKLPAKAARGKRFQLHRLSGVWVFLVDNAFFGATMASAGLALPVSCILAFLSGATGVFLIQKLLNRDSFTQALGKALIAGILSGIPSSIAGTIFGGWVIAVAGLGKKDVPVEEPPIDDQASKPQDDSSASH